MTKKSISDLHLALSPSRASDYKKCPLSYRLKAIDKIPEPKTEALLKGLVTHQVLENLYTLDRSDRDYPTAVKMIKPAWETMLEENPEYRDVVPQEKDHEFMCSVRELVKGEFLMENPMNFDAAALEESVEGTLPNGVPIRGFMDRVDIAPQGQVRIVDYKTGKVPAPRFSADYEFQMKFYALAYWRKTGVIPVQLRLMYLKSSQEKLYTPYTAQLERFEKELDVLWAKIMDSVRTGEFSATPNNLCGWCSFQQYCPEQGGTPPEYPVMLSEQ